MGVFYTVYSEVFIKDKWYGLDSYVLTPAGKYKLSPLLCGKSRIREALEHLGDPRTIKLCELSETLQKYMCENTYEEYKEQLSEKIFDVYDYHIAVKPKYSREYEYEYYASRRLKPEKSMKSATG